MRISDTSPHDKVKQRGAVLMVMIVILVIGITTALVGTLSTSALQSVRQGKTATALVQAKDALLGRAVSDNNRPGSLPCPDTDNDGSAELFSGNVCPNNIGRLPWRTLKISDLRDGNGERLWYALSPDFRDHPDVEPLNSNTKGTLEVYQADGATLQTQAGYDAVAVIFSPGSSISSQTRSTVAEQNNAANYLDIANTRNNATAAGPFISGTKSDTFNDQLLYITTKSLMPLIEKRVAGMVKRALTDYYTTNNYYPWAVQIGGGDYDADDGENRGWLPNDAADGGTAAWGADSPPLWYFTNQWYSLIYYSVAKDFTDDPGDCTSCIDDKLTVDGSNDVRALFFMPGTPVGTMIRVTTDLGDYLEDAVNNDDANDLYITPALQAADRDRLHWLSSALIWTP